MPERGETYQFLTDLFESALEENNGLRILTATLRTVNGQTDVRNHYSPTIREALAYINASRETASTYVGLALYDRDYSTERPESGTVGLVGVCADIDILDKAHENKQGVSKPLPKSIEEAHSLAHEVFPELPPTIVVNTGHGVQVWWLFREPYLFLAKERRLIAKTFLADVHETVAARGRAHGWAIDRLKDVVRIFRPPGTLNHKDPHNVVEAKVIERDITRRYDMSDFENYLIHADEGQASIAQFSADFTFDPSHRLTSEDLDIWKQGTNTRLFEATWDRKRSSVRQSSLYLADQSASGYAFSLFVLGVQIGFPAGKGDQFIINTVIEWFHRHNIPIKEQRWFELSLRKAKQVVANRASSEERREKEADQIRETVDTIRDTYDIPDNAMASLTGTAVIDEDDPNIVKLKEIYRKRTGIPVLRFYKWNGDDPQYEMIVDSGRKIHFNSITEITTFRKYSDRILSVINVAPLPQKQNEWLAFCNETAVLWLERYVGPETSLGDRTIGWLEEYADARGIKEYDSIRTAQELDVAGIYVKEGVYYVISTHFQNWIGREQHEKVLKREVQRGLLDLGAALVSAGEFFYLSGERSKIKPRPHKTVWRLPKGPWVNRDIDLPTTDSPSSNGIYHETLSPNLTDDERNTILKRAVSGEYPSKLH